MCQQQQQQQQQQHPLKNLRRLITQFVNGDGCGMLGGGVATGAHLQGWAHFDQFTLNYRPHRMHSTARM